MSTTTEPILDAIAAIDSSAQEDKSRTERLRKYSILTEQLCRGGITTNNNQSWMPTRNRCFSTYKKRKS
jgi:hypothetical protein